MRSRGLVLHPLHVFSLVPCLALDSAGRVAALEHSQQYPQKPHGVTKTVFRQLAGNMQSETRVEVPLKEGKQYF